MKKIIALCLSLVLVLSLGTFSASAAVDTSSYTKILFTDGGADFTNATPMNIDKWTLTAGSYNSSEVTADGYLTVKTAASNEMYGVTPKVTLPDNYVAEMTGIFSNLYCYNAAIRLKTVDTTSYYLLACWDGTNSASVKYGIATDIKADMNATYISDTFSIARTDAAESASWKFVVVDDTIEVWVNGELKLTYTNAEFTGATAVTDFTPVFYSCDNTSADNRGKVLKISGINIYREATAIEKAEADMTKLFFEDGGEDNTETPMNMDKWTQTTVGAGSWNSSNVTADGYLEVRAATSGEIQGVTPNTVIPDNYVAEISGVFYGTYNHQTGIRFKTVGTTNYYLMSTFIGNSQYKYGIGTDTDLKKDMNAAFVTGAPTFTLASADATAAADWRLVVADDTIAVYRSGELKLSYTNADFAGAVTHFDPVFFSYASYSADTAKKVLNITSAKMYREESAIEKAEEEMTYTLYQNDFEAGAELNSGDCSLFTTGIETFDSVGITNFDNKGVLEITQEPDANKTGRTTAATFTTEGINDYVLEAKLRGSASLPDSFAVRYRYSGVDGENPKFYALGYSRWNNSSNGSFGITNPNSFQQAANYKTQLTSYNSDFAQAWHTYKIVVSGMTAATYIDGVLVDEQTLNEGYDKGSISFAIFDQYHTGSKTSLYIDELTIKTRPVSDTKLHKVTKAYDSEEGVFRVDARVLASASYDTAAAPSMILAVYENVGGVDMLVKTDTKPITITQNAVSDYEYVEVDGISADKEYTAKLFVLDISGIKPVTESVSLTVE